MESSTPKQVILEKHPYEGEKHSMHHRLKPSKITPSLCSVPDCGTPTAEAHGQARDSSELWC